MRTNVTGEPAAVFQALENAFKRAGPLGHVVTTVTASNACRVNV